MRIDVYITNINLHYLTSLVWAAVSSVLRADYRIKKKSYER